MLIFRSGSAQGAGWIREPRRHVCRTGRRGDRAHFQNHPQPDDASASGNRAQHHFLPQRTWRLAASPRAHRRRHRVAAVHPRVLPGEIPRHGGGLLQSAAQRRRLGHRQHGQPRPRHAYTRRTRRPRTARAGELPDGAEPAPGQRGDRGKARGTAALLHRRRRLRARSPRRVVAILRARNSADR